MMKRQCHDTPTPRNVAAAEKQLGRLHNSPLIPRFLQKYEHWGIKNTKKIPHAYPIDTVSNSAAAEPDRSLDSRIYNLESNSTPPLSLEVVKEPKIEALEPKPFDSDTDNVLELWNETVVQWGIKKAPPLTPGVRAKVREALKYLKTREDWLAVFAEIPLSPFLMGRAGDRPFMPTLEWVVGHKTGDPTENYYKMLQGNYRDKNIKGGV